MRNTKQKKLILEIINTSKDHPNAYEIYCLARSKISNISLGTVYRILNSLVIEGLIKRIKMPDNIDRYDNLISKHNHFICIRCGNVYDVFENHKKIESIDKHKVLDCDIIYKGICFECMKEEI